MKQDLHPAFADHTTYADFFRRALAFVIDCMFLSLLCLVPLLYAFPRLLNDEVMFWYYDSWLNSSWLSAFLGFNLAAGLLLAVYSACFHAVSMRVTPGKRIMGIKVVDDEGKDIRFIHAFVRQCVLTGAGLFTLLPWLVTACIHGHRRGPHDEKCHTHVINRDASGEGPHPPRRLRPLLVGSVMLLAVLGIGGAINMAMWVNRTWTAWKTANQVVVVYKHVQLVHLMGDFMRSHDGYCPVSGRDFEQEGSPEKALIADARRYFEGINFKQSGRHVCLFTAILNVPWNADLHRQRVSFEIDQNPVNPKIDCDLTFKHESWVCTVSDQQTV